MPQHGGRLRAAAAYYGIPSSEWLDLSTAINPDPWPVPSLPPAVWQRLPEDEDGLMQAACKYYGAPTLQPVAGSQAAIQALPVLRPRLSHVGVLAPAYSEHAHAWRRNGHDVTPLNSDTIVNALPTLDVLVVVNPNNPTGECFTPATLLDWHARLAVHGGWLIIDEAFMDATPEWSLASCCDRRGLIVLRSLGKFFGIAGARVGFVLAAPDLLVNLSEHLGPWTVTGPSRCVATLALEDHAWQKVARARLVADTQRLAALLSEHGLAPSGGTALFQWVQTPWAARLHERLARRGVLTRFFAEPLSLRLALPDNETQWRRLGVALANACAATTAEATV
ncbi:MAG: threonine-phosphate decarboxylase CobD [Sulfuricaulis sp.]